MKTSLSDEYSFIWTVGDSFIWTDKDSFFWTDEDSFI
jgi:hypothetical protein